MAKGHKSSATAATRKKHALKSTGGVKQELPLPKEKKKDKGKGKKKEPRVKVFIPPSKPAPVRPDPLDSLGIAKHLPPNLLVALRRLGKKDSVTKRKALEELQSDWIDRVLRGNDDDGTVEATLVTSLPVWLHHAPSLFLSPSRRIRLLATSVQDSLLRISTIHEYIVYFLQETGDSAQVEAVLGSWCLAAEDVERAVATQAKHAWDLVFRSSPTSKSGIELGETSFGLLLTFVERSLFDPMAVYADLNPVQPAFVPTLPPHAAPRNKVAARRPPVLPIADEDAQSRRPDEEEESESDRKGRLRSSALGVLRWIIEKEGISFAQQLSELIMSPLLWTCLYHGPSPPFCNLQSPSGFIGDGQPTVRKAAWPVLRSLLRYHNDHIESALLPILSSAVLRSAWLEPDSAVRSIMWEPLLQFLTRFPRVWEIDVTTKPATDDPEESDDESSEEDQDEDDEGGAKADFPPSSRSEAFRDFLLFLELGCYGSPVQGYPTVIIVLSTVPSSILGTEPEAWSEFLTSFWAALDGRALTSLATERAVGSAAFLNALLECIVFLIKRSRAFSKDVTGEEKKGIQDAVRAVVGQQATMVWEELVKDRLRVQANAAGNVLARTFASLEALDESLFAVAWEPISSSVTSACAPQQSEPTSMNAKRFTLQLSLLKGIWQQTVDASEAQWTYALPSLIRTIGSVLVEQIDERLRSGIKNRLKPADASLIQRLTETLVNFSGPLFVDSDLTSRLDALLHDNIMSILLSESSLQLLLAFLSQHGDDVAGLSLWHEVLKGIASSTVLQEEALPALLSAVEKGSLSEKLKPEDGEMDEVAVKLITTVLADSAKEDNEFRRTVVRRLLVKPHPFISLETTFGLLQSIAFAFSEKSKALMLDADSSGSVVPLRTPLILLSSVIETRPAVALSKEVRPSLPDFFVFGHVLPRAELLSSEAKILCAQARQVWATAVSEEALKLEERDALFAAVRSVLCDLISDVRSRASPEAILQVVAENNVGRSVDLMTDLFPSQDTLDDMLHDLPANPLDPTLSIVDSLVPPPSLWPQEGLIPVKRDYDRSGLCEYARVVNSLLLLAADNRDLARSNIWLLRHFVTLSIVANERSMIASAASAFFSQDVAAETLREITTRVKTITAFLLSDVYEDNMHTRVVQAYDKGGSQTETTFADQGVSSFILRTLEAATRNNNLRDSKVLYLIVRHILNGASTADAENWMALSRRVEKGAPNAASAIMHAVNESGLEPASLDRYRNEIAASVLGVRASNVNSDGLRLLRSLALAAPDPESDVVFLSQPRAVNFVKACQSWVGSDEDIDEDVESEMTLVFQHLAPILQNIPGAHWDFIFDVMENNLENSSFSDHSSLVILTRTLKLILVVRDLASTNKSLRAVWSERETRMLELVRDIVQNAPALNTSTSVPRSTCWEMALTIMQYLPSSLIDQDSLPKMVHLILDPSVEVAKMAYVFLLRASRKRTEYLVVEAGVDTTSEATKFELPPELLHVLETAQELSVGAEPNVFAYLSGWMIVFDLFDEASLRVKMGYATQLRDLDLIGSSFLPSIFDLLAVYGGRNRPFSLDHWSVDEHYLQFYDPDSPLSPKLLAAHLYYRALLNVPSLISNWWAGCKDRQLLTAVTNVTTKYYSPVLIAAELRHVKDPAGIAELSGENWSIKVATGIGEVTAAYTVDDQDMEIAVRLPSDYPLHGIEVREVQKLGVDEKRWRGWLLAVQQIVTSQNGRIVDGLSMFKKNVTHHFENQTECAICYSIISVTELSLPKKRCKTCRNRFHAGCLFKWFNTSHTSSCPLCRSDFI